MDIRLERKEEYNMVENLVREAFWNVYRPGCFEHLVLHNLRNSECFIPTLDYVIEVNDEIIANIVYAKAKIVDDKNNEYEVLTFGPVSVSKQYQKQGFGAKIINYTIRKAETLKMPCICIMGNPEYYSRFGFVSASKYGIYYEDMDITEEAPFFMVKVLDEERMKDIHGLYYDPECYNIDEKELEEFEKLFPCKVKEKREGQLE